MAYDVITSTFRVTVQENASVYSTPLSINTTNYTFPNPSFDFVMVATSSPTPGTIYTPTAAQQGNSFSFSRAQFGPTVGATLNIPVSGGGNFCIMIDDASDWAGVYTNNVYALLTISVGTTSSSFGNFVGFLPACTTAPMPIIGMVPSTIGTRLYLRLDTQQVAFETGLENYYVPTTLSVSVFTW